MYSIDTSALIVAWHRDYRLGVFPSLWQRMNGLVDAGQLVASMTVRGELLQKEDTLAEWADGNPGLFIEDDEEIQAGVRAILADWPDIDFIRRLTGADLFVIVLAQRRGLAVVRGEKATGTPDNPKIPDACRRYGVNCIRAMDMFEELGWRF
jgi:Domain of unknown function (DUF4411)